MEEDLDYLKERYPESLKWLTQVNCAWCGAKIGFKAAAPHELLGVSHGICPACYLKQMGNLKQD